MPSRPDFEPWRFSQSIAVWAVGMEVVGILSSGGGHNRVQETIMASYLMATTIESGPTSGSTRVFENPASFIHAAQSAPV